MESVRVRDGSPDWRSGHAERHPHAQRRDRLSTFHRLYNYWKNYIDSNRTTLGYCNYVEFMMDNGRDGQPDGTDYTPLVAEQQSLRVSHAFRGRRRNLVQLSAAGDAHPCHAPAR